jgi:NAD-dependent SIR2 family protein deacetylase
MTFPGGHMRYVLCPKCGDPVAGPIPDGNQERVLQCAHCKERFAFSDGEIRAGIVLFDDKANRWKTGNPFFKR